VAENNRHRGFYRQNLKMLKKLKFSKNLKNSGFQKILISKNQNPKKIFGANCQF
jgi:hypothetical protein